MRRVLLSGLLAVTMILFAGMARAADPVPLPTPHPSSEDVKKEFTAVIDAQLAALRANDYAKAYTFAAEEIKALFDAAAFEKMVRGAYPLIAHSATADYGIAFDTGEEAVVNVHITDAEHRSAEYQYLLKKEHGVWKISGVAEVKPDGLSV